MFTANPSYVQMQDKILNGQNIASLKYFWACIIQRGDSLSFSFARGEAQESSVLSCGEVERLQ